jgi:N-acetylglucosamine malate deacetylase 1
MATRETISTGAQNAAPSRVVMAIGAHPDDIEFQMAGTLLLLREAGWTIHYMNVSSGDCGSVDHDSVATRSIRHREAREAARILAAQFHTSFTDDLQIFYDAETLRRVAAVIRDVSPSVILTHSPQDYMEDHVNTCRLVTTAAFARGMPNFKTLPSRPAGQQNVTLYHAMPHGLRDSLRTRIIPGGFVNTTSVHKVKQEALAAHKSQQEWLDVSQGMNSYLHSMEEMSLELGRQSKKFQYAEGWRRHLHLGFCGPDDDPLRLALGENFLINAKYEKALDRG